MGEERAAPQGGRWPAGGPVPGSAVRTARVMEPQLCSAGGPALPVWKREILERKRAKLAEPPAGGEPEPGGGGGRAGPALPEERLVLADSLGPLRENPFMRLESERRRLRQGLPGGGRRGAGRPLQELLELYSAVPGIRTIRADNILIIESQPDAAACFAAGEGARDPPPAASPRGRDSLRDLLARQGSALTEIRAAQVFVYEPVEPGQAGRVSRLLQKFDQWPRGRRRRSRDAEPNSPISPPARPAPDFPASAAAPRPLPAPGSSVSAAAPQRVPGPPASPANRQAPGSPGSTAAPQLVRDPLVSPLNRQAPGSPVSTALPQPVPGPPASPPNRRALTSSGSTAARWQVPGPPASPQNRRAPDSPVSTAAPQPVPGPLTSPPNRRAPDSPVSTAAPRPVPGPLTSPPNRRAPGSPVSTTAPQPVPGPPASPPNRRAPASPVSTAAPPGTSQASGFLHKIGSNSFTVTPRGLRPGSCAPLTNGPLEHNASPGGRAPRAKVPPVPSPSVSLASDNMRPKLEMSKEIQPSLSSATPSPLQPLSVSVLRDGVSFEIRPAPKPDLAAIPAHDLQAQALANLRLNSRNSFLFVPRRGGGQCLTEPAGDLSSLKPVCEQQGEPITPSQTPQELLVPVTYIDDDIVELDAGGLPQEMGPDAGLKDSEQPQEATSALGMKASAIPLYRPHPASSALQQRGSNTFTIVPKRKPPNSGVEVDSGASRIQQSEEEDNEESRSKGKTLGSPDAPQPDLEPLLKKRYPTVNEIEVIGGYLSLERSCMSKMGSRRKKMKISFSETSLQTTFEYPSESSLVEEEEEEESASEVEEDEDKPPSLFIPRPTCTMHANVPSSGFSSYTPKHSVEFSKWQEQEYEEQPASAAGPLLKEANPPGNQVMLTPADHRGLSDFSSEPALYF
ncbi:taperin [Gopherus evgoodei]|uniref:taperin n=1 Tax=Gopherus evgoodei TaxID=1825980 RepID=UPI0011CF3B62|nr:taperin [Gopherus evgoodei]